MARRVLIMGAAGKDFHVFNTCYRNNSEYNIVAFTATQIPWIIDRSYPPELAGELYPTGIPIHDEIILEKLIREYSVDECIFAYSDVSYNFIEKQKNRVIDAGSAFTLAPVEPCMVPSTKPVVAIVAVRTGCGKSQTTRRVRDILNAMGKKTVAARHPMPYGELNLQKVQRFATIEDLKKHKCTIEEMEEYEPHIINNTIVYAGVDYEAILREAEKEADVVLWDGGNNDIPFFKPDVYITVVDPHRAGDELSYYPSDENFKRADVIVFNKMDTAPAEGVEIIKKNVAEHNPEAIIVYANSPTTIEDESIIKGKKVLVVEDGPTCTHGGMKIGAGTVAAKKYGAAEIVDPRPFLVGSLKETFDKYPEIGNLMPAMGYSGEQIEDLEKSINATECEAVVIGTPIDLRRLITIDKPSARVTYDLEVTSEPSLEQIIKDKLG